jgi:D-alanine transfer protein
MMPTEHHTTEQMPHLAPALTAVILGVAVLEAFAGYARSLESRSIKALATDDAIVQIGSKLLPLKNQGTALQQAALETACLLPVYGSSELNLQSPYSQRFHPSTLLRDLPTGFTIFPVGKAETTCLITLQKLASLGPALEGRKIAISLSPMWFFERQTARAEGYAGNFSALHAGELAFNVRSSLELRQDAARRMLQYPATLADRPLLRFALENLVDGSPLGLARYEAALPLGMLHNAILRYQDHWNVVSYLRQRPFRAATPQATPHDQPLYWPKLQHEADRAYRPESDSNQLGLDNKLWKRELREVLLRRKGTWTDEAFLQALANNQEWVDLELVLRELTEFGARPLLLSTPLHGGWYDECGITSTARRAYYEKLRAIAARYHAAVADFADHEADIGFCQDSMGHLAPRGFVYYCQVLDGFFHGTIQRPSRPAVPPPAARSEDQ